MNKTLAITAITLVAVIMGMSTIAPMIPQAFAHEVPESAFEEAHEVCFKNVLPSAANEKICDHPPPGGGLP